MTLHQTPARVEYDSDKAGLLTNLFSPRGSRPDAAYKFDFFPQAQSWMLPWSSDARSMFVFSSQSSSDTSEQDENSDDEVEGEKDLSRAARRGDLSEVTFLVRSGADVNTTDITGETALFKAASRGHTAIVASLLLARADVLHKSKTGATPFDRSSGEKLSAMMMALAPASAGLVADAFLLHEAIADLPESMQELVLDEAESGVRTIVM